jgi:hypothetical protein
MPNPLMRLRATCVEVLVEVLKALQYSKKLSSKPLGMSPHKALSKQSIQAVFLEVLKDSQYFLKLLSELLHSFLYKQL